jgi:phosphoglycerate dehydrogenase-like enzyme
MPKGVPVATFAIGAAGAANAALFAVAMLAWSDPDLRDRLEEFRKRQTENARGMMPNSNRGWSHQRSAEGGDDRDQSLCVLGGGQLARMFAHAAQTLGYRVVVLDPIPTAPRVQWRTSICVRRIWTRRRWRNWGGRASR